MISVHVWRNKYLREDTHLNCIVFYRGADGRIGISDFVTDFQIYEEAEEQINFTLKCCTPFVKANWARIEVYVPNRDLYGRLQPGWTQDCGILLATRQLEG